MDSGVSGGTALQQRPEGRKLLKVVQVGDVVIVTKLDRMFRSALDALAVLDDLQKRGVELRIVDLGGPVTGLEGRLVFTVWGP